MRRVALPAVLFVLCLALVVVGVVWLTSRPTTALPVDSNTQRLMSLSEWPGTTTKAPDVTLTDQHGNRVSLSALRGRSVVLTFLDLHCTDICPIVSTEFVQADALLGTRSDRVAIVAVNVNPYANSVSAVAQYSEEHGLSKLANFSFLTGSPEELRAVWKSYGIFVQASDPSADVVHTSVTYFIDPLGNIRYQATPQVDKHADGTSYLPSGQIAAWANGISQIALRLAS